jgi:hypothetical protein
MPSSSIALASARMPRPEVFSERKSSSMMTMGKRNFMVTGEGHRGGIRRRARSHVCGRHFRRDYTPGPRRVKGKSGRPNSCRGTCPDTWQGRPRHESAARRDALTGAVARRRRLALRPVLQGYLLLAVRADDVALRFDIALIRRRAPAAGRAMNAQIHLLSACLGEAVQLFLLLCHVPIRIGIALRDGAEFLRQFAKRIGNVGI